MKKKLYRVEEGKKICGVCAGLALYFDVDVTLVRIIWLILVFCFGTGILLYFLIALIMPTKSEVIKLNKRVR